MNQDLVIKLNEEGSAPIGVVESPPMLYTNLFHLFPDVEFNERASAEQVEPLGYGVYEWAYFTDELPHTQSADNVGLSKHSDGVWRDTFVVRDATAEEIAQRTENETFSVRAERNRLLRRTDWTQLADAPIDNTKRLEYATYRQALRDVPAQSGFPFNVVFPEEVV